MCNNQIQLGSIQEINQNNITDSRFKKRAHFDFWESIVCFKIKYEQKSLFLFFFCFLANNRPEN